MWIRHVATKFAATGPYLPSPALPGTLSRKRERGWRAPRAMEGCLYFGCTTVIVAGVDLPTPRNCGRYMSSTSDGGTV